jgi:hypothetical protein
MSGNNVVVNRFGTGETALVYVVKITESNPDAKPLDVALAELDLADWYLLFDKPARAVPVYVHTRQLMRERAGMSDEEIAAYFGRPTPLYLPVPGDPPPPPLASHPEAVADLPAIAVRPCTGSSNLRAARHQGGADFAVRPLLRMWAVH